MEKTNILALIITLVVSIILAGSLLMPVIEDATESISGVEYNEPAYNPIRMSYGTPSDDLKVEKPAGEALINMYLGDSETPYYTFPLNTDGYVAWALVTSTFSYGITGGGSGSLIDYTARTETGTAGSNHYGLSTAFTANLNVTTGAISLVLDGTTYSHYAPCDVERIYWADPNGDYVNVVTRGNNHPPIYLEDPKDIIGSLMIGGNYVFWQNTDNVEVTNGMAATVTTTTTTQENGLYVLDKISYEVTGTDAKVRTGEMGHCIVKYQVGGNSGSDAVISLIQTLPILVIVALIVASIAAIYTKRN